MSISLTHHPHPQQVKFGVFGLGSSMYEEESFCKPAIQLEEWFTELGATPLVELGTFDLQYTCHVI